MATFRSSNHQISASSVYTNGDLANLIENLYRQSLRAGANGDYARGLYDMAQSIAAATNTEIDLPYVAPVHPVHPVYSENIIERYERIEERRERTVERYAPPLTPPAERQFKIVGEREPWPAPASTSVYTVHRCRCRQHDRRRREHHRLQSRRRPARQPRHRPRLDRQ